MTRRPIADHALLSDCQSAALVTSAGSVDWLCLPRFDSPSVFARILDDDAGHWSITPAGEYRVTRRYIAGTLVLETRFDTPSGAVVVTDALALGPPHRDVHAIGADVPHTLLRAVEWVEGTVVLDVELRPRPEYGLVRPQLRALDGGLLVLGGATVLGLSGPAPLEVVDGTARWRLTGRTGDLSSFALHHGVSWETDPSTSTVRQMERDLRDSVQGWQDWSELHQGYRGPWQEQVRHSGRVLRGLTFSPTGAIVAAPTTSLPETVGGGRNWDYRYTWLRDASMTLQALWVAACPEEANRFVAWLVRTVGSSLDEGGLQIMYGLGGEHDLSERELPHLRGWRDSAPVRVGNGAWDQRQTDVFGEVLDAVHRLRDVLGELDVQTLDFLARLVDAAANAWREPDQGIWEMRGEPRHHLYSKLMCWVALDRGIRLFTPLGGAQTERVADWGLVRDEIRTTILARGWNAEVGAYTQTLDGDTLDASALMLAITGFLAADDPRMSATIERIAEGLTAPDGLVYRYQDPDGLDGDEATFVMCSYWLAECLALAGEVGRARQLFEHVTAHANDLGLLGEEIDPTSDEQLGNFPQAFSHVGLVNAACAIAEAESARTSVTPAPAPPPPAPAGAP